jgi:hypothetical protein
MGPTHFSVVERACQDLTHFLTADDILDEATRRRNQRARVFLGYSACFPGGSRVKGEQENRCGKAQCEQRAHGAADDTASHITVAQAFQQAIREAGYKGMDSKRKPEEKYKSQYQRDAFP